MKYADDELRELRDFYRDTLLDDTLKFWLPEAVDEEYGGYLLMRDREGELLDDDKAVWHQGRFASVLGALCNGFEAREEWVAAARTGVDFLRRHCFDDDGQMFFLMTREGRPLRKRRYFFSEAFAIGAYAQVAKLTNDEELAQEARGLFKRCMEYVDGVRALPAKYTDERKVKGLGVPMIFLHVAQNLHDAVGDDYAQGRIEGFIREIRSCVNDELRCVLECVSEEGELVDHLNERTINPGHAMEAAWFLLHEVKRRGGDEELQELALKILDYSWEQGWDEEYGGLLYFRDPTGKPVMEYWQDMKFWWPQNEAIIATLMAYLMTGNEKYARWHRQIHGYAHEYFWDREHGEWFGYLHRDGRVSTTMKGNHFKGPFHVPRMQWACWQLLEERLGDGRSVYS